MHWKSGDLQKLSEHLKLSEFYKEFEQSTASRMNISPERSIASYTDGKLEPLLDQHTKKSTFKNHFKAILFRKTTLLKRSYKSIFIAVLGSIFFSGLAIVISILMKILIKDKVVPISFNSYMHKTNEIFIVEPNSSSELHKSQAAKIVKTLEGIFKNDTGKEPKLTYFDSRDEINKYMYENAEAFREPLFVAMGLDFTYAFKNLFLPPYYNFTLYYNGSWDSIELVEEVQLTRALWKNEFGYDKDFTYSSTRLLKRTCDLVFSVIGPVLICAGLTSLIPLFIFQPITDIKGDVRSYMESCSLTKSPYWLATFLVDCITWFVAASFTWLMFFAAQTTALMQNKLISYYVFVLSGPSYIMMIYCFSFAFDSAESAPRQAFIILVILMVAPIVAQLVVYPDPIPIWCEVIFSFIPHLSLQRFLTVVCSNIYVLRQPFSYYFKNKPTIIFIIQEFTVTIFYFLLLLLIEYVRKRMERESTKRSFASYTDFFIEQKNKHPVSDETRAMEQNVLSGVNKNYAVRIEHVSRLFFNTTGDPIPAVNDVSLGVKKGSIFGFLGANGAGKTTLIKMITSLIPPSEGTILVNGEDIADGLEPNTLAICPQFNSHLCMEMTVMEHFKLYSMIYQLDKYDFRSNTERLLDGLGMNHYKNKPAGELSGGEQRKLAIALAFLSPATIVLLDEPTSSLDPVARHHVHDLIASFKDEKTFMLCTHLLSEAEALCDMISIMIKGNVYTCGSPQYLSNKFGTEYKIDVALNNESLEVGRKLDAFISERVKGATLSIKRPKARIYSMPAAGVDISDIFNIMEEGCKGDNGFSYYTCSSSSLESVFMEIVHMSENEEYESVRGNPAP